MDTTEKTHTMELTEAEVFALNEGLENPLESTITIGNNPDLLFHMAEIYLKQYQTETKAVLEVVRNYTTLNSVLLLHRSALLKVSEKAMGIIKTL